MSNFIFYLKLAIYMIGSLIRKTKVEKIRKNNGDKAAEEYIYNNVLDWATFIVNETGVNIKVEGMENLPEEAVFMYQIIKVYLIYQFY